MTDPNIERFGPDTPTDALIKAVDRDGCAIVHEALSPARLSRLNSEFDSLIETTPPGTPNHIPMLIDFMGAKTVRIDGLPGKSKTFVEVLQNPQIRELADHYLLPSCIHYLLSTAQLIEIQPGETVQALHRDDSAWIHPPIQTASTNSDIANTHGNASDSATQLEVVVLYALSDFTAENGATRVVPGSHRWPTDRKPRKHEIIAAEMPAGSAIYYLGKTLHGGGPNTTPDVLRRAVFLGFSLGWLRTKENFFLSTPIEAVRSMPKPVQRLLGYETHGGIGVVDVGCPSVRLQGVR
jgi:Phytanoyl-CoA dioxygenase (PhyH)